MDVCVGSVVEGYGEVRALPVVIRRVAAVHDPALFIHTPKPTRISRYKLIKPNELERALQITERKVTQWLASRPTTGHGAVLVVLDSDGDCPEELGPRLLKYSSGLQSRLPCSVVLAHREFEAWFLAAAESLCGRRGLELRLQAPPDPEGVQDAKKWLRDRMRQGSKYSPALDQPALAALFDLDAARRSSPSFDKCFREIVRLLSGTQHPPSAAPMEPAP